MLNPPFGFCTRPVHPWTVMVDTFLGHFFPTFFGGTFCICTHCVHPLTVMVGNFLGHLFSGTLFSTFLGEHLAYALVMCIPEL